jgi:F-type H+-transporting ATPase subunit gamma
MREHSGQTVAFAFAGRKARDFYRRRGVPIHAEAVNIFSRLEYSHARQLAEKVIESYSQADFDSVYLVYNEFKSVIQQRIVVEQLLPLKAADLQEAGPQIDYIYEQPPQEIFNRLLPRYVEIQIYRALLESAASEHGARMAAMDTATRNAGEMIDLLTLNMNRVRQAAITREIIEVVSGAGAL